MYMTHIYLVQAICGKKQMLNTLIPDIQSHIDKVIYNVHPHIFIWITLETIDSTQLMKMTR
jgi:hypothetical protein